VIPAGIWGTHRRWPRAGRSWAGPLRPRLGIAYGPPLHPEGDAEVPKDVEAFVERVRSALEAQVAEARELAADPARSGTD
jgi:1-acyl-sn-glycerol-3-phosphate acyltransferase